MGGKGAEAKEVALNLVVTKFPAPSAAELLMGKLGVEGVTLTPAVAKKYGVIAGIRGVLLTGVKPDGVAGCRVARGTAPADHSHAAVADLALAAQERHLEVHREQPVRHRRHCSTIQRWRQTNG